MGKTRMTEERKHGEKRSRETSERQEPHVPDTKKLSEDLKDVLDDIDKVLEEESLNAMEYRQQGGE